jgi:hypothetical protein
MKILWAYGDDSKMTYHNTANRGVSPATFVSSTAAVDATLPAVSDTITKDYLMNTVVPSE